MIDFKNVIANAIAQVINVDQNEIKKSIEKPKGTENGDYAFPCFRLAKTLRKAPQAIAIEIKEKIKLNENEITKLEVVGGYLNFFVNKELLVKEVLQEMSNDEEYCKSTIGNGKNIVIDYSAPNIAKPFHIGHLRSTVIGNSLYKTYKFLGYNCIGINHLGDYGTQFGKLIEGLDVAKKIVSTKRDYSDKPYEDQVMKKVTVDTFGENFGEPEIIED